MSRQLALLNFTSKTSFLDTYYKLLNAVPVKQWYPCLFLPVWSPYLPGNPLFPVYETVKSSYSTPVIPRNNYNNILSIQL